MRTLPDFLRHGMKLIVVGCNPGDRSARVGHYYAGRGNQFWPLMYDSGVIPEALTHIDAALRMIEANGDEPIDVAFLLLARANAGARMGAAAAHRRDLAASDALAATWDDPGLKAWYAEERGRIRTL